jgi:hypothetical protein
MAIESLIEKLIAALEANTAAHTGKAAPKGKPAADDEGEEEKKPAAKGGKTTGKGKPAADDEGEEEKPKTSGKKKITREELTAVMNKVKDELGAPVAKAIIKSFDVERLAEIDDSDIEAAYKKAQAKLDKAAEEGKGEDDGL